VETNEKSKKKYYTYKINWEKLVVKGYYIYKSEIIVVVGYLPTLL